MENQFVQISLTLVGILSSIGVFVGGIGYLIKSFRKGGNELTDYWKEQALEYKAVMLEKDKSNDEKFQALHKEIGEIRGQLIAKEEQNKEYLAILQNRDPETKTFMKETMETMKQIADFMTKINKHMEEDLKICTTVTHELPK